MGLRFGGLVFTHFLSRSYFTHSLSRSYFVLLSTNHPDHCDKGTFYKLKDRRTTRSTLIHSPVACASGENRIETKSIQILKPRMKAWNFLSPRDCRRARSPTSRPGFSRWTAWPPARPRQAVAVRAGAKLQRQRACPVVSMIGPACRNHFALPITGAVRTSTGAFGSPGPRNLSRQMPDYPLGQ